MSWNKYGKDGEDIVIQVPPGTAVRDNETGELIHDFTEASGEESFKFLTGGNGGWGNVHFKSSTNQAPRIANKGEPGEERELRIELSIMADLGLVGFPNAGKSSLLEYFTNARPKIAPYPFTTKVPNLGVLRVDENSDIIIADIPGIIEGASDGAGLGIRFLKHISRTVGLIFMIDCGEEGCVDAYEKLLKELSEFGAGLMEKQRIVLCNKIDLEGAKENAALVAERIKSVDPGVEVIPVSVAARTNMDAARTALIKLAAREDVLEDREENAFAPTSAKKSSFMAERSVDDSMEIQFPGSEQ